MCICVHVLWRMHACSRSVPRPSQIHRHNHVKHRYTFVRDSNVRTSSLTAKTRTSSGGGAHFRNSSLQLSSVFTGTITSAVRLPPVCRKNVCPTQTRHKYTCTCYDLMRCDSTLKGSKSSNAVHASNNAYRNLHQRVHHDALRIQLHTTFDKNANHL